MEANITDEYIVMLIPHNIRGYTSLLHWLQDGNSSDIKNVTISISDAMHMINALLPIRSTTKPIRGDPIAAIIYGIPKY